MMAEIAALQSCGAPRTGIFKQFCDELRPVHHFDTVVPSAIPEIDMTDI
ncbi:hypothetical protein [Sphingobium phenoxybenzoativorans]|nr:hypothetical protein [Sphingobium phenoxybenzoativorans]